MPPFDSLAWEQEQIEQQQDAAFTWHLSGQTDATTGELPQYSQEDYLRGYTEGIKSLPLDREGRIIYPSLRSGFAFGYVDCAEQFQEF